MPKTNKQPEDKTMKCKNEMGELLMLDKNILVVDQSYQRDAVSKKIVEIQKNFDWLAFGVITIGLRDGVYYVVDGQHRVLAARNIASISAVPCIVFETESAQEEAKGFLTTQMSRKMVDVFDKFKARKVLGDKLSLDMQALVEASGRKMSRKSSGENSIACIGTVERLLRTNPHILQECWPVICVACRGAVLDRRTVEVIHCLHANIEPDGIYTGKIYEKLTSAGSQVILGVIKKQVMVVGSYTPRQAAHAVLKEIINKGSGGKKYKLKEN